MASPFPGMDPYLEDPTIFPDVHDRLIVYLAELLDEQLPPTYHAGVGSRVWKEEAQLRFVPDSSVLKPLNGSHMADPSSSGAVAIVDKVDTEAVVVPSLDEDTRQGFVNIVTHAGNERLVTAIEILSPSNKTPGAHGREAYRRKQREVLSSNVHLVEIDLLRAGYPTTAVPADRAREYAGWFDYHVCISRFDRPTAFIVYPISIRKRLPAISIPLLSGDEPVAVDLQRLLERCYDAGRFRRRVHYSEAVPVPPLSADTMAWAEKLLRDQGLIGSTTDSSSTE